MCESEFNLENRVLCMDGNCIGVVGPDGNCRVCGLPYEGDEALPPVSAPAPSGTLSEAMTPSSEDDGKTASEDDGGADSEAVSDERVCCIDDSCIGIIGPDGLCGTCGKAFE